MLAWLVAAVTGPALLVGGVTPVAGPAPCDVGPTTAGHGLPGAGAPSYFPPTLPLRPIGSPVPSTRNRYRLLAGALLCLLLLIVLTVVYKADVRALDELDNDLGAGPQGWTFRHPAAQQFLLFVEVAFTTLPMTIYTAIAAGLLFWRKHGRAALWTVVVMLGASLTTYFL